MLNLIRAGNLDEDEDDFFVLVNEGLGEVVVVHNGVGISYRGGQLAMLVPQVF